MMTWRVSIRLRRVGDSKAPLIRTHQIARVDGPDSSRPAVQPHQMPSPSMKPSGSIEVSCQFLDSVVVVPSPCATERPWLTPRQQETLNCAMYAGHPHDFVKRHNFMCMPSW